ncbi:AAA family ATPase [Oscillatoria sp. HE19RPO]|uniref:AAA family ATPase n=1 Tax=Oscillatoria sp. HE19RPO TaxID=2954806 RepID=UPI002811C2BC|nr:AAA family ATPase [Oscillatoria sp. HE19RPO]
MSAFIWQLLYISVFQAIRLGYSGSPSNRKMRCCQTFLKGWNNVMSLLSICATDYKNLNFYSTPLELKSLNILVGPNGSGKSNLMGLLNFLYLSVSQNSEATSGFAYACDYLGGTHLLSFNTKRPGKVSLKYEFGGIEETRNKPIYLGFKLLVSQSSNRIELCEDYLYSPIIGDVDEPFYYYKFHDQSVGSGVFSISKPHQGSKFERISDLPVDSLGLLSIDERIQEDEEVRELLLKSSIYAVRKHLLQEIKGWRFYNANNMNSQKIRNAEPKISSTSLNTYLSETGENLAAVLEQLSAESLDFEERFNEAFKQLFPMTRRIRATRAGLLNLTLEWSIKGIDEVFYLRDMSDGSVRMLCWAVILLSPKLPSLLVIDEPELGIHVAWMKILAGWIHYAAQRTKVIISTHSPDLLDCFTDRSDSVISLNLRADGWVSLDRIQEEQFKARLQEGWELGDLYRVGDPSIGGWPW